MTTFRIEYRGHDGNWIKWAEKADQDWAIQIAGRARDWLWTRHKIAHVRIRRIRG